jgi:hypothetical protein
MVSTKSADLALSHLDKATKENRGFTTLGVCGANMGKEVKLIPTPLESLSYPT